MVEIESRVQQNCESRRKTRVSHKKHSFSPIDQFIARLLQAQSEEPARRFGFVLKSSMSGVLGPLRLVPSATYTKRKNQLELGLGFNLFDRSSQKLLSTEFNYKHFPNGLSNKYNMYFITRLAFINRSVDAFYPINLSSILNLK